MFPPEHSLTHAQTDGQPENIVFNQSPFRRFGATWVEICPFPLLWLLAFTHGHRESKKQGIKLLPITSPNFNRFSKLIR